MRRSGRIEKGRRRIPIAPVRAALAASALALALLGASAGSSQAAFSHGEVQAEFATECTGSIADIAVHEASETVYVGCNQGGAGGGGRILRYDYDGEPVDFSAAAPYIDGNALIQSQTVVGGVFPAPKIAVDNAGGPEDGTLYVTAGRGEEIGASSSVETYGPSGVFSGALAQPFCNDALSDVDVGPDGSIYVGTSSAYCPRISRFSPTGNNEVGRMIWWPGAGRLGADSTGAIWTRADNFSGLFKIEADQFTTNFPAASAYLPDAELLGMEGLPSPFVPAPLTTGVSGHDVDFTDDDLYINKNGGSEIHTYSSGEAGAPPYRNAPAFGGGILSGAGHLAVTLDHRVFVVNEGNRVVRFGPGDILPDLNTRVADIEELGHTEATLRGDVSLAGGEPVTSCELEYGRGGFIEEASVPCDPAAFGEDSEVSAAVAGLTTGALYRYRFRATTSKGTNLGRERTFIPPYVLRLKTLAAEEVEEHGAVLTGSFEPDHDTTYHFEYGVDDEYGLKTASFEEPEAAGEVPVGVQVDQLPAGRTFHYRIVASNVNGITFGPDMTFRTASTPDISGVEATEIRSTSAVLNARVNPVGYDTEYRFEYGKTTGYGQETPLTSIGSGSEEVAVSEEVAGLEEGFTYHFRVVATSKWGTAVSADTTFDFSPPSCPNGHVRQETATAYLPDCRAYELVSPGAAGAVQLMPSDVYFDFWELLTGSGNPFGYGASWVQNTGLATSPARFTFAGVFGTVEGLDAPNQAYPDTYMATRSPTGWTTTLPGVTASTASNPARGQCSESLDLCVQGNLEEAIGAIDKGNAPFLYEADGTLLGRLPTNLGVIPEGFIYEGLRSISGDLSHFVFSSINIPFAPGGVVGGVGSAYDNDLGAHSVEVISKTPGGADIPQFGSSTRPIEFPAVSADGSHVLMQTEQSRSGPYRLYVRVNGAITYEIAGGASIEEFVGMTRDGAKVLFTSAAQLTEDDSDSSTDLYMWSEAGDELTVVSQGSGNGDTDECAASWADGCDIAVLDTERRWPGRIGNNAAPYFGARGLDDMIAADSGDVYFYSPEALDGTDFGIPNQRNLYIYRGGAPRLVTTLDAGSEVQRIQISRDGSHAALLTDSRLTSYDNGGHLQVYAFDAESGEIRCASCPPSGLPATADAEASQGGPFMADDGRTFFATRESLVPRDKNGNIIDVYEYVDGRPQLITTGVGSRDFTGESEVLSIFTIPEHIGLEAVSRDGRDVYFSTYETLVSEDQNGSFVKFYDARTGGGFPADRDLAPCAAADECHGPDSARPTAPLITTNANLGASGNVTSNGAKNAEQRAKRKLQRRRARQRRKARRARNRARRGRKAGRARATKRSGRRRHG
jgi:hypothetical protein